MIVSSHPEPSSTPQPLPALRVEHPGVHATIQDLGRPGLRAFGVPAAGAFDLISHTLANALVGNEPHAATLELTLLGGRFLALVPLCLALAGAPMPIEIESPDAPPRAPITPGRFLLQPGERLRITAAPTGSRAYLAVAHGWQTPLTLHSRSSESPLQSGDTLPAFPAAQHPPTLSTRDFLSTYPPQLEPERSPDSILPFHFLPAPNGTLDPHPLATTPFLVHPDSNRLGIRLLPLDSPLNLPVNPTALSRPVLPGTIQWTGEQLFLLGPAGGTLGGYPVLGQLPLAELPRLAQLRPGDHVAFQPASITHARQLAQHQRQWLHRRATQIRLRA